MLAYKLSASFIKKILKYSLLIICMFALITNNVLIRIYGKFTMEVILATAFGIQSDVQTNADEPYTPNAEELFKAPPLSAGLSKLFFSGKFK